MRQRRMRLAQLQNSRDFTERKGFYRPMPEQKQPKSEGHDPLWDALREVPQVPIDPFFSKRVAREAAAIPRKPALARQLFANGWLRFATCSAAAATIVVALGLGFVALRPAGAPEDAGAADPKAGSELSAAIEHGMAAVGYVDYFDELVATEDPTLLSDEDIIALIIDDGSSALLF